MLPGSAVPGQAGVLDEGVPWLRFAAELDIEWDRLLRRLAAAADLAHAELDHATVQDLDGPGRYVLGAWAAATWTLGHTAVAPVSRAKAAVSGRPLRYELAAAERVMTGHGPGWELAAGALHWLLWITSAIEEMPYPGT